MKKYTFVSCILLVMCWGLKSCYKWFPNLGETYYSLGINKWWIELLSTATAIVPFSIFEMLIYIGGVALVVAIIMSSIKLFNTKRKLAVLGEIIAKYVCCFVVIYTVFVLSWGLNYNRPPMEITEQLVIKERTVNELVYLYEYLLDHANRIRPCLTEDSGDFLQRAYLGYEKIEVIFPEVSGSYGRPKPILASKFMNYTGITGIYSPFTGEANVNMTTPHITLPVTILHEMAHQRGYTGENECNFLGYIAAINHPDYDFQYSGYMFGIIYVGNALYDVNPQLLWDANQKMSVGVRQDLDDYNAFWDNYQGKIEEIASSVNNTYLQANGIDDGVSSYGRIVDLMLAFYEKYGYDTRELVGNDSES